jgi:hypothetical protein
MTAFMGGPNALAGGFNVLAIFDDDRGGLYRSTNDWSPRARGSQTVRQNRYYELWRPSGFSIDCSPVVGNSWNEAPEYEASSAGDGGVRGAYFIKGQVLDANGVAQTGVHVTAFRASDNLYVADTYSDSNGYYSVATPYSTSAHFIIAYLDTAIDLVGTTVNNLTPSSTPWP